MKSTDFCYWLQGAFELNELNDINATQTSIIKEHLNLVFQYDSNPNKFCYFLKGFLANDIIFINSHNVDLIKAELSHVFKTVIDLSYPQEEQTQMNKIHKSDVTYRC